MGKNTQSFDVAIIGGGPAGITAAIYGYRANLKVVIFTDELIAGKINKTLLIENFPSFKTGTGAELAEKFAIQAEFNKIPFIRQQVIDLTPATQSTPFQIMTNESTYQARFVIVATGTKERKLPLKGAEQFEGKGISYCAACDGAFFKNLKVAVVGGGNSALEETKVLAKICSQIYLINRENKFHGQQKLIDHIKNQPNIEIFFNSNITRFGGKQDLEQIEIVTTKSTKKITQTLDLSGVFIYIGSVPNNNVIKKQWNILDSAGYILTNHNFQTKIPNLYAVGDIAAGNIQQYTTAMGSATIAITDIIKNF